MDVVREFNRLRIWNVDLDVELRKEAYEGVTRCLLKRSHSRRAHCLAGYPKRMSVMFT